MNMETMNELYEHELADLYSAEKQMISALPEITEKATSPELKSSLEAHFKKTKGHAERLEEIFDFLGKKPSKAKCKGMEGILKEGEDALKITGDLDVRDAAILASAQKVEHYEIATYGSALAWAKRLGLDEHTQLLADTLNEEKEADTGLTTLSKRLNKKAQIKH